MNYNVNKTYHFSNRRGTGDQYMDWFTIGKLTIANQGGIRARSFWNQRKLKAPYNVSSLILLISNNHEKNKSVNPWEPAEFDQVGGKLIYKGDSRKYKKNSNVKDSRAKLEHMGNKQLRKIEMLLEDGNKLWLPPLLYFSSVSVGRYSFKGLFIAEKIETYFDESPEVEKENYKIHCQRMKEESVPINWLRDRCRAADIEMFDNEFAPLSWQKRSAL